MSPHAGLKVFGYARVSTDDQRLLGKSLEDQPEKIRWYCERQGLDLVELIEDGGKSSKSLDRPGIQKILTRLRSGEAKGIVVTHLDRLTRHIGDMVDLVDEFFTHPDGCHLFSCDQAVETRTAAGRMQVYFMILMSQYFREMIVENTVGTLSEMQKRSERTGNLRFGTTTDAGDGRRSKAGNPVALIACLEDIKIETEIMALRTLGMSTRAIATKLNERGIPSKRGVTKRSTGRWSHSTVAEILKRGETCLASSPNEPATDSSTASSEGSGATL